MIRRWKGFGLSLVFLVSGMVMAHSGKVHVMGTVMAVDNQHLKVKAGDGQIKSILLNEKTTFKRKEEKVDRSNLKVGFRVVVHAAPLKDGDLIADEIQLSPTQPSGMRSGQSKLGPAKGHEQVRPH